MSRLEREIEALLEAWGFELVTMDRSGGHGRSRIRVRIDRSDGPPGRSDVSVEDCARVAGKLRAFLEARPEGPSEVELEVSSPGVERPLVRPRDYHRFAGHRVRLRGYGPLAEGDRELEGRLLGLGGADGTTVGLELAGGRVEVPLGRIASARLVVDWDADLRGGGSGATEDIHTG